jgi:hypothetical protein
MHVCGLFDAFDTRSRAGAISPPAAVPSGGLPVCTGSDCGIQNRTAPKRSRCLSFLSLLVANAVADNRGLLRHARHLSRAPAEHLAQLNTSTRSETRSKARLRPLPVAAHRRGPTGLHRIRLPPAQPFRIKVIGGSAQRSIRLSGNRQCRTEPRMTLPLCEQSRELFRCRKVKARPSSL